jgi:C_GCAxxG_C_C family probable redox protein
VVACKTAANRKVIPVTKTENALKDFESGFSCAQAVFTAFAQDAGLPADVTNCIACAFGGGIARRGLTCGAVSGALMVIGLKYGNTKAEDKEAKNMTYAKVNEFCRLFIERHGSLNCGELLGCDIGTEEGMKYFREQGLAKSKCNKYVTDTCEILINDILKDE